MDLEPEGLYGLVMFEAGGFCLLPAFLDLLLPFVVFSVLQWYLVSWFCCFTPVIGYLF
jgi:hypothetical protein